MNELMAALRFRKNAMEDYQELVRVYKGCTTTKY